MGKIAHPTIPCAVEHIGTGSIRVLAESADYRVSDMHCWKGPHDPVRANEFPAFRVAAVVRGAFGVRSSLGDGVPVAGSLLMGNARGGYICSHDTALGDRCINFDFQPAFLEEVRAALGIAGLGEGFPRAVLPPASRWSSLTAIAGAIADGEYTGALDETVYDMAATALTANHADAAPGRRPSWNDERRIMRAARFVEAHCERTCTLESLAAEARMSRFHFLRVFRRVLGATPHRYVLATRLRYAARRLLATRERIADIAGTVGFGDLSNFNVNFSRAFGVSPRAFRLRGGSRTRGGRSPDR